MDHGEVVANFVAITGADEAQALQMLSATDFNLEQVRLYEVSHVRWSSTVALNGMYGDRGAGWIS